MRQPAWMDGVDSVWGKLLSPSPLTGEGRGEGEKRNYPANITSSPSVHLHSRITIKHVVTRLIAGGLLFFTVSATHATAPIGATPGSFAVDPSGAVTYSIPIFVPPGTNGMQPQLSLNYNSQGGNGLVGMGWSIGGLSVIHRCGSTIAIDGVKGGVNYNANDKFCLDGERLISIGGSEYRTQHESWQKVVASDTSTNPASFTVTTQDGIKMFFGAYVGTTDAQILAKNKSVVRIWALKRIQDLSGNYLTIAYQNNGFTAGEYYPASISYTGNGSIAPYNFVYFDYSTTSRIDVIQAYEGGSLIGATKLLADIRACTNSTCAQGSGLVRKYIMTYDNDGAVGRSRLKYITECGSDGVCLPTTVLGWQGGGNTADFRAGSGTYIGAGGSPSDRWFTMADVDGDGKTDAVKYEPASGYVSTWLSTGTGFTAGGSTYIGAGGSPSDRWFTMTDVDGDGKTDSILYQPNDGYVRTYTSTGPFPDLLTSITNGLSGQANVTYKPLTDSSVYTKDTILPYVCSAYPCQDVQNATYVVSQSTQSDGIGGDNTTTYQYAGLKTHLTTATSLGFRQIQTTDPAGLVHITNYNQTLDCTEGTIASSERWASGVRVKYVGNTWTPVSLGGGICYARLASSVEETRELNNSVVSTVNTSYSGYDSYGSPGTVTVDFNDGWSKTTLNSYDNDTVNWQLGKLTYAKVTGAAPGQGSEYRESSFTYDSLGRVLTEVIEPNRSTLSLTTTYGYDSFGNRTSKTLSGPDIVSRTESQIFTTNGQFPLTKTNALGHSESYVYDPKYGTVTSQTGPNGLTTTWSYDGFGRKVVEIRPDGTSTTINYKCWDGNEPVPPATCPTGQGYATETLASGSGAVWAYFDILGRPIRSARISFDGIWVYTDAAYDNLGRQISASQPDFNSPPAHHTTYTHDVLGRVLTVTAPGNRVTTTIYNGLTTTVTNPKNQSKTTVKNSQGHVVNATDNGGTTSYVYDPFGNLKSVTGVDGSITSMTYDIRGRKIAMSDPDMGPWSYGYNVLGELTSQTDAKNQTITMAYDKLGRMVSRVLPAGEGTSTWTYDTAANGIGKLASVSNPNTNETYTYDSLGRPSTQSTSVSGVTYTVTTAYDALSRVDTITYPETGFRLKHVYDSNQFGFLKEVKNDTTGASYWKINAGGVDALNRIINETYGNGLISQRQYAAGTSDLDFIKTGTAGSPTSVQNETYGFDELGNVIARGWWDGAAQRSEIFDYDSLNRLTSVTGPAPKVYSYHPNGNIQFKTGVGTYNYPTGGVRPHAVTSTVLSGVTTIYDYDANGNMLTGNGRTITYTSFNKPQTIAKGGITTTLTYNAGFNRLIKSNSSGTTIYIGKLYERATSGSTVTQKHYIYAGPNQVGVYSKVNTTTSMRYFHTDHLGSVDTITNETGGVVQRLSYDAWGKRRNADGTDATSITAQTTRGFTRHEHDDEVGLVNMNAREFDPLLGRFITPDTIIQFPYSSQGMNRYTYVNNNPLSFTDPSGHGLFKKLKRAVQKIAKAGIDIARAPSRAVDHYITRPVIRHIAKHHPNALPYLRGAAVAVGSFFGGPGGGAAVAAKFDYETCRAMGCDANDAMRAGLKGGATHYASVFVSDVFGSSNAGVSKISLSQTIGNSVAQTAVAQYAERQGINPIVFNAGLFALSWTGDSLFKSRFQPLKGANDGTHIVNGIFNRGILGVPFDAADVLLSMQGYLTPAAHEAINYSRANGDNFVIGKSLGALDVSNIVGQGYAGGGLAISLPFPKISAPGLTVMNGGLDPINFGLFGSLTAPGASNPCLCAFHDYGPGL